MLNNVLNEDVRLNVFCYLPDAEIIKIYLYNLISKEELDILFKNTEYTIKDFTDLNNKIHFCKYINASYYIHFTLKKNQVNFIEKNFKGNVLILHTEQSNMNSLRNIVKNFKEVELHLHGKVFNLSVLFNMLFDVNNNLSICIHSEQITVNDYTETTIYAINLNPNYYPSYYPKKHLKLLKEDLKTHPFLNALNCTIGSNYLYFKLQ